MKNHGSIFTFIIISFLYIQLSAKYPVWAVTCVPVTDVVGQPLRVASSATPAFKNIPLCSLSTASPLCPRLHQLLFNEVVEILAEQGNQVQVAISNLFFISNADTKRHNTRYWGLKNNFIPLSSLENQGINVQNIPEALSFTPEKSTTEQTIVSLITPWHEPSSNRTFSAGTRFVVNPAKNTPNTFAAYMLNSQGTNMEIFQIPRSACLLHNAAKTPHACIKDFTRILRTWAHMKNGFIPYVWGGCSVATLIPEREAFTADNLNIGTITDTCYAYPSLGTCTVKTGLDCTGLASRAAQIAGIPYYLKNSITVATCLEPLQVTDSLTEGDIIWVPGHVMVVSNLEKNLLVEARHYAHGYGKVQEIKLSHVLLNMQTYQDLVDAFLRKQTIQRIDKNGKVRNTYKNWKILRIASAWDHLYPV